MASPLAVDQTQVSPLAPQNAPPLAAPVRQPAAAPQQDMANYTAAIQSMGLSPQEQALYQRHLTNLSGPGGVTNPDGSRSTLFQITAEFDGKTYVIPTVWDGQIVPPEQAIQLARQAGLDSFPSYSSQSEADARYEQMHGYMEKDTESYLKAQKK